MAIPLPRPLENGTDPQRTHPAHPRESRRGADRAPVAHRPGDGEDRHRERPEPGDRGLLHPIPLPGGVPSGVPRPDHLRVPGIQPGISGPAFRPGRGPRELRGTAPERGGGPDRTKTGKRPPPAGLSGAGRALFPHRRSLRRSHSTAVSGPGSGDDGKGEILSMPGTRRPSSS